MPGVRTLRRLLALLPALAVASSVWTLLAARRHLAAEERRGRAARRPLPGARGGDGGPRPPARGARPARNATSRRRAARDAAQAARREAARDATGGDEELRRLRAELTAATRETAVVRAMLDGLNASAATLAAQLEGG